MLRFFLRSRIRELSVSMIGSAIIIIIIFARFLNSKLAKIKISRILLDLKYSLTPAHDEIRMSS